MRYRMWKTPFLVMAAAAVALPLPVLAASYPFNIKTTPGAGAHALICVGPPLGTRSSSCVNFSPDSQRTFYTAEDFICSAKGLWDCHVDRSTCATAPFGEVARTQFCGPGFGDHSNTVELFYDHDKKTLTHNQLARTSSAVTPCPATVATSALGFDGEDAAAPGSRRSTAAAPGSRRSTAGEEDVDTFDYDGEAGETVDVTLAVDGSTGGFGEVAMLRIKNELGEPLAEQAGPLPLTLQATLEGPTAIVVERSQGIARPSFRGGYTLTLEVVDASGELDERPLIPRENVEQ